VLTPERGPLGAGLELRRLEKILDGFRQVRLLVVGDVVLDEYLWGDVERVSPEAPVPVVHVHRESTVLGGAGNVVRNVLALGAACEFCAAVGEDRAGERVVDLLGEQGVDSAGVVRIPDRPTTYKTRVVARAQQVVRFDRETSEPVPPAAMRALLRAIDAALPRAHGVVLEDYGKGLFTPRLLRAAMRRFEAAGTPVSVDPKTDLSACRGASLVKPNLRETEVLAGICVRSRDDLVRAADRLRQRLGGAAVAVTRGAAGMTLFSDDLRGVDVPTPPREVFDVQGAGDTAIATLTLALRAGGSLLEAAVLANAAAGVVVGKVGTATASPDEVREHLPAALAAARGEGA
jgi:D-beta-D-heptose 7-phosphate kinase/D-beta-D-heptose 1-phosphate adenosyltransferase